MFIAAGYSRQCTGVIVRTATNGKTVILNQSSTTGPTDATPNRPRTDHGPDAIRRRGPGLRDGVYSLRCTSIGQPRTAPPHDAAGHDATGHGCPFFETLQWWRVANRTEGDAKAKGNQPRYGKLTTASHGPSLRSKSWHQLTQRNDHATSAARSSCRKVTQTGSAQNARSRIAISAAPNRAVTARPRPAGAARP